MEDTNKVGKNSSNKVIIILLILLFLLVLGLGGLFAYVMLFKSDNYNDADNGAGTTSQSCTYDGATYEDGDGFDATDGCNSCMCSDGNVVCTLIACLPEEESPEETTNYVSKTISCQYSSAIHDISFAYPDFVTYTDTTPAEHPTLCSFEITYNGATLRFFYYGGADGPLPTSAEDGYVVTGYYGGKQIARPNLRYSESGDVYTTVYGEFGDNETECAWWTMGEPPIPCVRTGYLTGTGSAHSVLIPGSTTEEEREEILSVFDDIVMSTLAVEK